MTMTTSDDYERQLLINLGNAAENYVLMLGGLWRGDTLSDEGRARNREGLIDAVNAVIAYSKERER